MNIDATFWVAISFFIFCGGLIYLKVPKKINNALNDQIEKIKKEINEAKNLKIEAKNLLSEYENKIDKSKNEAKKIIDTAKKENEKNILEKTKKFHETIDNKKKSVEQKIYQMKENAIKDIKDISIRASIETVENIIKKSIDKNKLEKFNSESLKEAKNFLKQNKA